MKIKKLIALGLSIAMISSLTVFSGAAGAQEKTAKILEGQTITVTADSYAKAVKNVTKKNKVGKAVNKFSLRMLRNLAKGEDLNKNMMISPISILMAMGMVENGASGETLAQMEKTMGCSLKDLNSWLKSWRVIQGNNQKTKTNIANSVWFKDQPYMKLSEPFMDRVSKIYGADIFLTDFGKEASKKVNQWVKDETYGMIDKLADSLDEDLIALLLNATAFEGKWAEKYTEDDIVKDQTFTRADGTKEKVDMLSSQESTYFKDSKFTGFTKAYEDGYYFAAFLPKKGMTMQEAVASLTATRFNNLLNKKKVSGIVNVTMPSFKYDYETRALKDVLAKMGMKDLFDGGKADLSKMIDSNSPARLYVSDIIHKTHIELDKEGTKAAAITAIEVKCTSMPMEEIYNVRLDRPFIYAIVDQATGTPVFVGTVASTASK